MARVKESRAKEPRERPPRRVVMGPQLPVELLACGDPRTYDEHEIQFTACGTRVCDLHPTYQHICRIKKHKNPGHIPDP